MDKDPTKAKAGRIGATKRWGEPRVVRLDELTTAQRRLVLALVEAAKEQNRRDPELEQRLKERAATRVG